MVSKGLLIAASGVVVWLATGTIVYYAVGNVSTVAHLDANGSLGEKTYDPWTLAQAFYFSVQTGLSIGFGLLSETQTGSKVYSIFHILAGSSLVGGALALFANLALLRGNHFMSEEERKIALHARKLHVTNCFDGVSMTDLHDMMCRYPHYFNIVVRKVDKDDSSAHAMIEEFRTAAPEKRRELCSKIIREAKDKKLPEFSDEKLSMNELQTLETNYSSFGIRMKLMFAAHYKFIVTGFLFLAWITIGTIFSVVADENDFVTGVYFAISTLSTAGMVSVKTVDSQANATFTAFFALLGVPLYGTLLGMFANVLTDRYNNRQVIDTLHSKFSASEKEYLEHLSENDGSPDLDLAEFLEIQMLRLGLADRSLLRDIRKQFESFDKDKKGRVTKEAFIHKLPKKDTAAVAL